ncbi:Os01g0774001, partial [Oryza sativa Japonica Group]
EGIHYALFVTVCHLFVLLFAFNFLCDVLNGASFNLTAIATFHATNLDWHLGRVQGQWVERWQSQS